jgi:hypothetical protein
MKTYGRKAKLFLDDCDAKRCFSRVPKAELSPAEESVIDGKRACIVFEQFDELQRGVEMHS